MGRGDALGYDFAIPQNFIGSQQSAPLTPPVIEQPEIPNPVKPGDYLAHVEGLSDKYYNIGGLLRSFTQDMAKKGVDVTTPDYSQPGGGELFKSYQKLSAELAHTANELANSNDINKFYREKEADGKVVRKAEYDPTKQLSSQMRGNDMYTSTEVAPQVEAAAKDLAGTFYTQRDAEAKNRAVRDPLIAYYQDRMQKDPANAQYYQNQISAIPKATAQTAYQQLIPRGGSGNGKVPPGISVLKKIVNLSSGVWNDGTYKPVTKDGKVFIENAEMVGESMGQYMTTDKNGQSVYKPKIIKRWLKDPETGVVSVEYQDSEVPMDVVSNQPGAIATNFISNNSKYGDVAKTMDIANSMGIIDDTGSVIPETLTPENADQIRTKVKGAGATAIGNVKAKVESVKSRLKEIKDPIFGNNSVGFKLPGGKEAEVKKHRGKNLYYIADPEALGYPKGSADGLSNLSEEEVISILSGFGKFDDALNSTATPVVSKPKAISVKTLQSLIGQPGYEGQTLESLQQYYSSHGYTIK